MQFLIVAISTSVIALVAGGAALALVIRLTRLDRRTPRGPLNFDVDLDRADPAPAPAPAISTPAAKPAPPVKAAPPRLEAWLLSRQAPPQLRLPVRMERGRMLELSLPARVSWTGALPLRQLTLKVTLPNAITYGGSLQRLAQEPRPGLPASTLSYAAEGENTILTVLLPELAGQSEGALAIPICIKPGGAGAYPVRVEVSCDAVRGHQRSYMLELEVVDGEADRPPAPRAGQWVCIADDGARAPDPALPLERIASTRFLIHRGASAH